MANARAGQSSPSFDGKKIFVTPDFRDYLVVELLSRKLENYVELAYGTAHPDTTLFPNHDLVFQVEQDQENVIRFYAADRAEQDAYNYGVSYLEESNAHPIYPRDYIVRRSAYAVIAKLTADPIHATALLVKEDMLPKTGDDRIDSLYVLVRRIYETLPGPELYRPGFEPQTGAAMKTYTQRVARATTTARALTVDNGTKYNGQYVIDSYVEPINSVVGNLVTVAIDMPPTLIEKKSVGFQFPARFTFLGAWSTPPLCVHAGPYAGVNYELTQHRTASKPAEVTTSYSLLIPSVSDTWTVISPGSADRFFGIGANTIHNAIFLEDTCGAGTQIIEDLPESTPNAYDPTDVLLIQTGAAKWKGFIFEKTEVAISETN